jgi:hypothetical protein
MEITGVEHVGTIRIQRPEDREREFDCSTFLSNNRRTQELFRQ